jgi:hypothetical protein
MALVEHEINMLVTSDANQGAKNKTANGAQFEIQLEAAIKIPEEALNVTLSVQEATIWWSVPNIITGVNDKLYCIVPRGLDDLLTAYIVIIPQGLYDLTALNNTVARELENLGAKLDGPLASIQFSPDNATQRVEIRMSYIGSEISFVQVDTFKALIGFDSQVIGPTVIEPITFLAENTAAFNTVNYFLIHSDLVGKGIRFNNQYNQTIAQVLIDVLPGSQIVNSPRHPAKVDASDLRGTQRKRMKFWLTDDNDNQVNTNNENWTARISIKYMMPHVFRHGDGKFL